MPSVALDKDYSATYVAYRHGPGYVAKGIVFYCEKPVKIFDAYGPTIPAVSEGARALAEEIWKQLRAPARAKCSKTKSGLQKKRLSSSR